MLDAIRRFFSSMLEGQEKGAQKSMLEELFYDMYRDRKAIYKMNFVRGIFFGLGSALGGTLVLALIVWTLSFFVEIPVIGDYARDAKDTIDISQ